LDLTVISSSVTINDDVDDDDGSSVVSFVAAAAASSSLVGAYGCFLSGSFFLGRSALSFVHTAGERF
jgi:hypothetical protein